MKTARIEQRACSFKNVRSANSACFGGASTSAASSHSNGVPFLAKKSKMGRKREASALTMVRVQCSQNHMQRTGSFSMHKSTPGGGGRISNKQMGVSHAKKKCIMRPLRCSIVTKSSDDEIGLNDVFEDETVGDLLQPSSSSSSSSIFATEEPEIEFVSVKKKAPRQMSLKSKSSSSEESEDDDDDDEFDERRKKGRNRRGQGKTVIRLK